MVIATPTGTNSSSIDSANKEWGEVGVEDGDSADWSQLSGADEVPHEDEAATRDEHVPATLDFAKAHELECVLRDATAVGRGYADVASLSHVPVGVQLCAAPVMRRDDVAASVWTHDGGYYERVHEAGVAEGVAPR